MRNFNESCGSQREPQEGRKEEEEKEEEETSRKALLTFHRVAALAPRTPLA